MYFQLLWTFGDILFIKMVTLTHTVYLTDGQTRRRACTRPVRNSRRPLYYQCELQASILLPLLFACIWYSINYTSANMCQSVVCRQTRNVFYRRITK